MDGGGSGAALARADRDSPGRSLSPGNTFVRTSPPKRSGLTSCRHADRLQPPRRWPDLDHYTRRSISRPLPPTAHRKPNQTRRASGQGRRTVGISFFTSPSRTPHTDTCGAGGPPQRPHRRRPRYCRRRLHNLYRGRRCSRQGTEGTSSTSGTSLLPPHRPGQPRDVLDVLLTAR